MKVHVIARVLAVANYTIEENSTVRHTAKEFKVSKSTVHRDLCVNLPKIDKEKAAAARLVLNRNKVLRCSRGGLAAQRNRRFKGQVRRVGGKTHE